VLITDYGCEVLTAAVPL